MEEIESGLGGYTRACLAITGLLSVVLFEKIHVIVINVKAIMDTLWSMNARQHITLHYVRYSILHFYHVVTFVEITTIISFIDHIW